MGFYGGFDGAPPLSSNDTDNAKWRKFLATVKGEYKNDLWVS